MSYCLRAGKRGNTIDFDNASTPLIEKWSRDDNTGDRAKPLSASSNR